MLAALARDAALGRIGTARRWTLLAAVAMTAGLALLASSLLPGKSLGASRKSSGTGESLTAHRAATGRAPALPSPAGPSQLGLQGPAQTPQSSPSPTPSPSPSPPVQSAPPAQPAPSPPTGGGAVVSGGS